MGNPLSSRHSDVNLGSSHWHTIILKTVAGDIGKYLVFPSNEFDFILVCYEWACGSKISLIQNILNIRENTIKMGLLSLLYNFRK